MASTSARSLPMVEADDSVLAEIIAGVSSLSASNRLLWLSARQLLPQQIASRKKKLDELGPFAREHPC